MAQQPEPLAIDHLVRDHHQELYRYAFRLSGGVQDAEDLTQQAFLVAQQKLDQVRRAECARSWLYAVLRNCYLKSFRRRLPTPASVIDLDIDNIAQQIVEQEIDGERLQLALDELPAEYKVVVLLFYFEQQSYREIAEELEIPPGTVMSRLSRAKSHLRKRLLDRPEDRSELHTNGGSPLQTQEQRERYQAVTTTQGNSGG